MLACRGARKSCPREVLTRGRAQMSQHGMVAMIAEHGSQVSALLSSPFFLVAACSCACFSVRDIPWLCVQGHLCRAAGAYANGRGRCAEDVDGVHAVARSAPARPARRPAPCRHHARSAQGSSLACRKRAVVAARMLPAPSLLPSRALLAPFSCPPCSLLASCLHPCLVELHSRRMS